jgi:hypothetical protein
VWIPPGKEVTAVAHRGHGTTARRLGRRCFAAEEAAGCLSVGLVSFAGPHCSTGVDDTGVEVGRTELSMTRWGGGG